ncbi:MAG TPA: tetratricopeptide repeat protein [Arenicellales bacterium]|nr:tetratricopeptide repeat protein [Arenicellales bacterium]
MDDRLYRFLKYTAVAMALGWIGWSIVDTFVIERVPGSTAYQQGNILFEDGDYADALEQYDEALAADPASAAYTRAKARTLMQLGRYDESLTWFDRAVAMQPFFGGTYANRGILHDRMGNYRRAVADYSKAVELDERVAEGPHWLVRFLRNQPEPPPTVADRLAYLKQELAKPESERLLRVPELDSQQRTYKK